jgi:NitT/TauT family transport system permease protein
VTGWFYRALLSVALPLAGIAAALLLVEYLQRAGHLPVTLPAPSQVWGALLANPRGIGLALGETTMNAVRGYAVATVVALGAAFVAALVAALRPAIYNLGVGLSSIPLIAATPLLALWLGNGPLTRSLIAGLASYFPLLVGAMQGFRAYETNHMELFHVYSASRWRVFRSLILPSSLPYLFAGFKLAAPLAVLGSLTAELTGGRQRDRRADAQRAVQLRYQAGLADCSHRVRAVRSRLRDLGPGRAGRDLLGFSRRAHELSANEAPMT